MNRTRRPHRGGGDSWLIDPGSISDFSFVSQKVTTLLGGMERVSTIFINHQDPDVGSIAPKILDRYAPHACVLCSESTYRLARHTGLKREQVLLTNHARSGRVHLPSGHQLQLIPTPYVHASGAVMLYDPETRVLFTGDFFGGLSDEEPPRIDACEEDWQGVRAFHQIYMPSMSANRRAIDQIRALDPFPEILAPQHGYLVRGALVETWLERMYELPCGLDIIDDDDRHAIDCWNDVLKRVLWAARTMIGDDVISSLAHQESLQPFISMVNGEPHIQRMGRQTLSQITLSLAQHQPQVVRHIVYTEAIRAAEEAALPTPALPIEDMGDTHEEFRRDQPTIEVACIDLPDA